MHIVLTYLVECGYEASHAYHQESGKRPLHHYDFDSAHATLGSLTNFINFGFDKYQPKENIVFWRSRIDLPLEEAEGQQYASSEVAKAVEILRFNKEVIAEIEYKDGFPSNKTVRLTQKGYQAFLTDKYSRKAHEEELADQQRVSMMRANHFTIINGVGAVVFAALAFIVSALQYCDKDAIKREDIVELKKALLPTTRKRSVSDTVYIQTQHLPKARPSSTQK